MNPNKALWEKGDFTAIAPFIRESSQAFVESLGITPGMKALDIGSGDGNTAIPMNQLGADVTGVDIATNLLAAARRRAEQMGLTHIRFEEGDACNLEGLPDESFDLTVSVFGAMFAPKPFDVARAMVRVTRPGGRVVMGNWIPGDPTFVSQVLKISSAFTPPPPEGFVSPMLWGVETDVLERFGAAGIPADRISVAREMFYLTSKDKTPQEFIDLFRKYYGPTMNAFEAAEKNGNADELYDKLVKLANSQNETRDGGMSIPAACLRVTVRV